MHFQMTIDKDELNLELLEKLKALIDGPGKITLTFKAEEGMVISKEEILRRAKSHDVVSFTSEEFDEFTENLLKETAETAQDA